MEVSFFTRIVIKYGLVEEGFWIPVIFNMIDEGYIELRNWVLEMVHLTTLLVSLVHDSTLPVAF